MAIPLTGRRLNVGSDTALPLHAGVQLVALGVRQGGVALAEVGALLVVQDAALLGLIASGQCQQQAGRDERCKLPKTHCFSHLQASRHNRRVPLGKFLRQRSEERRVGKEYGSTCRSRWWT